MAHLDSKPLWGGLREKALAENISVYIPKKSANLIDIGCGDGYLLYYLEKKINLRAELEGLDLNKTRLKRARTKLPLIKLFEGNIMNPRFKDNQFDTVICSELLEHLPNYKKALKELIRITKKTLIITVPNDQPRYKTVCPKCGTEHCVDGHINRFNLKIFKQLLSKYENVKIEDIKKFHTIYSYNKLTLKLPFIFRNAFDQILNKLSSYISFFKPNYFLIKIIKK